ncbi:hypothetical protein [Ammonifex thiophilus]|nr:hypothetical protein [Ammonifex thiophilus]
MVRHGEVQEVRPDSLKVKVEKGGGDVGKEVTARTTEFTSVQVGMGFVNRPGEKVDLTRYFRPGDRVDMLYRDGQALALHRDLRPGEQEPRPPAAPGPQAPGPQQPQPQGQGGQ